MATDKFPVGSVSDSIIAFFNALSAKLRVGNVIPRMSEAEILAARTADTDIIVSNTDTGQVEIWTGLDDRIVLG